MTLGEKITALRIENNLTQEELAKKLNTTKQTIYKYEKGIVDNLPLNRIQQLADALGASPAYLMGWEEKEPAAPTEKELLVQAIVEHVSNLTPDQIRQVIQYAQFLAQNQAGV